MSTAAIEEWMTRGLIGSACAARYVYFIGTWDDLLYFTGVYRRGGRYHFERRQHRHGLHVTAILGVACRTKEHGRVIVGTGVIANPCF
ncbi:hypothetical protein M404DRAFT_531344 [Pisolithus tinctorius Marx 270]|uniref:Uncharacterized protein n=1 Tax=Pisolithus tinctorius Marx 270 TaxID=870435 RepID=A0A0C3J7H6_PISTI|nr:hypothetical protein M404DRAFT_531344 [Pisolithus tinctorius Marx 270]